MRKLAALAAMSLLVLTGCSSSPAVEVSAGCTDAMQKFGDVPADDLEGEAAALTVTVNECKTADEYLAAVHANPGAWTYETASDVDDETVLILACLDNADAPVCVDAKAKELI